MFWKVGSAPSLWLSTQSVKLLFWNDSISVHNGSEQEVLESATAECYRYLDRI